MISEHEWHTEVSMHIPDGSLTEEDDHILLLVILLFGLYIAHQAHISVCVCVCVHVCVCVWVCVGVGGCLTTDTNLIYLSVFFF